MAETYGGTVAEALAEAREGDLVLVAREGARATLTRNDPEKLNPLSAALTVALRHELEDLARDPELKSIVLTGTDPAFSAGGGLAPGQEAAAPPLGGGGGAE